MTAHGCDRETEPVEELGTSEEVTGRDPHPKASPGITHAHDISLGALPNCPCAGKAGTGHSRVWDGHPDPARGQGRSIPMWQQC